MLSTLNIWNYLYSQIFTTNNLQMICFHYIFLFARKQATNIFLFTRKQATNIFLVVRKQATNIFLVSRKQATNIFLVARKQATNIFLFARKETTNICCNQNYQLKLIFKKMIISCSNTSKNFNHKNLLIITILIANVIKTEGNFLLFVVITKATNKVFCSI